MQKELYSIDDLIADPAIPFRSKNTIKAHIQRGDFPAPVAFGPRLKRWHRDTIEQWKAEHRQAA